ncbi:NAD-dependent protein deacylase [Aerophototrophica crusticola]|uniref:NAD-dependent protein deacylase n=1 Tax=Aerophototrophica crusticola TaxID=1709002 RepID=A0A858R9U5_9PROT|nr:NAD-dependent protein deacylase [Rhodospirillaceae bacterium B3]
MDRNSGIVVLTGAGISRESGLHTFRDADGIWAKVRLEDVATPEAFARDPDRVQAFYDARRRGLMDPAIQPNAAHRALAAFESRWPGPFLLVTQNIDDLHDRAGSKSLVHMHGELLKARCLHCRWVGVHRGDLASHPPCPNCGIPTTLRPHVVWFGEMPLEMERITHALSTCGLFISIGTSGNVYPAANFVAEARTAGALTVELNLEESAGAAHFHDGEYGPATTVVPDYLDRLLAKAGV